MSAIIITLISVLAFVVLSPIILISWLISLIIRLFKAIASGIDNAWNEKQAYKHYQRYGYRPEDRYTE